MFGALLMLVSGAVVAATPATPLPWFEFTDYPMKAFEKKHEGVTQFQLLVTPDGRIADCTVTSSSGHKELDRTTCFLATKRAQFRPARGPNGEPVFGVYRSEALWALPEHTIRAAAGSDLEVSLNKLPDGTEKPLVVKLAYSVDQRGNPSDCTVMPSSRVQTHELVELGCKELLAIASGRPVVGPAGQSVQAVKTAAVRFTESADR